MSNDAGKWRRTAPLKSRWYDDHDANDARDTIENRVRALDERFLKLRLFSATVERLATGLRWAEGPMWFGDGRYLLVSDIPNNRIVRWDEASGALSDYRAPSNNANGNFRDRQGRFFGEDRLHELLTSYAGRSADGRPPAIPSVPPVCSRRILGMGRGPSLAEPASLYKPRAHR